MPRNLTAWIDLTVILCSTLFLVLVLLFYNIFIGLASFILWLCMVVFTKERCKYRSEHFTHYCKDVISNVNPISNYAIDKLSIIIVVINREGRLQWFNDELKKHIEVEPEYNMHINTFWPNLNLAPKWGSAGKLQFKHNDTYYSLLHRPVTTSDNKDGLLALYIMDNTELESLRKYHKDTLPVIVRIQIDNYDEVTKGISPAEKSSIVYETTHMIDEWVTNMNGMLYRISTDNYCAIIERQYLEEAIQSKFDIIDKIHTITNTQRMPVTISIGAATEEGSSMNQLGVKSQARLDMALSRGGDQVAILIDNQTSFFGGKSQSTEKNTRVKARIMATSLAEHMERADEIFIMGHANEDFDSLGAAVGIARIAKELKKPVHIVISDVTANIDKILEILYDDETYENIFIFPSDLLNITAKNPLLIVVDTHIPTMVADPSLLTRIKNIIVIDHHRKSEHFIKNTLLTYQEPSPSSTCEMVTEIIQYFPADIVLSHKEATALYTGIIVDTKNFMVQVGARTFDAASYLKRSGTDNLLVRRLFKCDFETNQAKSKAKASAKFFPKGLIATTCPNPTSNVQVIAAQVADSLLYVEGVRASIVVFQLNTNTVGISARSNGDINVQVILEGFGGGGHLNVAGAQIKNKPLKEVYDEVVEASIKYIEENDKDESNSSEGLKKRR